MAATPEEIRAGSDAVRSAFALAEKIVGCSRVRVFTAKQKDRVLRVIVSTFNQLWNALEGAKEAITEDVSCSLVAKTATPPDSAHAKAMTFSVKVAGAVRRSSLLLDWNIPSSTSDADRIRRVRSETLGRQNIQPTADAEKATKIEDAIVAAAWPFSPDRSAQIFDDVQRRLCFDIPDIATGLEYERSAAILDVSLAAGTIGVQPVEVAELTQRKTVDQSGEESEIARQHVTLDQISAIVGPGASKPTLNRMKSRPENPLPDPDIEGGGGKSAYWIWSRIKPWLEEEFGRILPDKFPTLR